MSLLRSIRTVLPRPLENLLVGLRHGALVGLDMTRGLAPRDCPICGYHGRFYSHGSPPRYDAKCGRCNSLERHRTLWLAMEGPAAITDGSRVLHFAAEKVIARHLRERSLDYRTADIDARKGDLALNIEAIAMPDASHDVVIANHVLEHVDDAKALAEIRRILKPGGRLLTMVPLCEGYDETYENPEVTSPRDRRLHFGLHDHLRYYGRDFRDRLTGAGFQVAEFIVPHHQVVRYSIHRGERVFIATRALTG